MSTTRGAVRLEIRSLSDRVPSGGSHAVSDNTINQLINNRVQDIINAQPRGTVLSSGLVSLQSNVFQYSLGGSNPSYTAIVRVQHREKGLPVWKVTLDKLIDYRRGVTPASGPPRYYALMEQSSDNTLQMLVWPTPGDAENGQNLDIHNSVERVNLTTDTDQIFFQDAAVRAMVKKIASEVISMMPPQALQKQGLNPEVSQGWAADFDRMTFIEDRRIQNMRRQKGLTLVRR